MDTHHDKAVLLLKIGIAFAFLYPAFSAFIDPASWIGYVPMWINTILPRELFLSFFSTTEILIAAGILFWNNPLPSLAASVILISIVIFNSNEFTVIFRDIAITCAAFALASLLKK